MKEKLSKSTIKERWKSEEEETISIREPTKKEFLDGLPHGKENVFFCDDNGNEVNESAASWICTQYVDYDGKVTDEEFEQYTVGNEQTVGQNSAYLAEVTNFIKQNTKCKVGTYDDTNACGPSDENIYKNLPVQLTTREKSLIAGYTHTSYAKVNYDLRHPNKAFRTEEDKKLVSDTITVMEKAINNSPLRKDMVLYRGMGDKFVADNFDKLEGSIIQDKGFISTTTDIDKAGQFAGVGKIETKSPKRIIAKITVPKGTNALRVGEYDESSPEKEYILQHGTSFKVNAVDKSGSYWRIDMEVVPSQKHNSTLTEVADFFKLNYKCRKEDSPDGSNKCTLDKEHTNIDTKSDVISQVKNTKTFTDVVSGKLLPSKLDNIGIELAKEYGLDKPPISVSESELDNIIESGSKEITRIVTSNEYVKEFTQQEKLHMSNGLYGTGIYTAYKQGVPQIEDNFHKATNTKLYKIRMAIDNTANIITIDNITSEIRNQLSLIEELSTNSRRNIDNQIDKLITNYSDNEKEIKKIISTGEFNNKIFAAMRILISDPGIYAILKGYDAIDIPDHEYLLVLNRNKLYVQRDTATQNSAYLQEAATYLILSEAAQKLNANCKKEEKVGEGPGSCSTGNKDIIDKKTYSDNRYTNFLKKLDINYDDFTVLSKSTNTLMSKLPPNIKGLISEYTDEKGMNDVKYALTGNKYEHGLSGGDEPPDIENGKKIISALDQAISQSKLPSELTLYKGISLKIPLPKSVVTPGSTFSYPGFNSTSLSKQTSEMYSNTEDGNHAYSIEIQTNPGDNGLFLTKDISLLEEMVPGTLEVVLPRNQSFTVVSSKADNRGIVHLVWKTNKPLKQNSMKLNYNCPDSEKSGSGPGSCKNIANNINNESAIQKYTADSRLYKIINGSLALGTSSPKIQKYITEISNKINDNKINKDLTVFRGISKKQYNIMINNNELVPGKITKNNRFTSTTLDEHVAKNFAEPISSSDKRIIMKIDLPKNSNAMTLQDSKLAKENEVLIDHGSNFQFINKEEDNKSIILHMKYIKNNSAYLGDVAEFFKTNSNCKAEEKVGTGPGSCSGGLNPIDNNKDLLQETYIGLKVDYDYQGADLSGRKADLIKVTNPKLNENLSKLSNDLDSKTTHREKLILRRYTNYGYYDINDYLSGKLEKESSQDSIKRARDDINSLDKIFKNANLPIPITTFRGIKDEILTNSPELSEALDTPGSEINCSCFSSSSVLPFVAENFASGYSGRMLEIHLPKGSKALYISDISTSPSEFEVLINRDTKFEVGDTKSVKIINPYKEKNDRYVKVTTLKVII